MSLTSYRAAPPRGRVCVLDGCVRVGRCGCGGGAASHRVSMVRVSMDYVCGGFRGPGGDRLSRTLGCSIIGAGGFHVRVRDGIGCSPAAMATRLSEPPASASMAGPRIGFDGGPPHRLRWRVSRDGCVVGSRAMRAYWRIGVGAGSGAGASSSMARGAVCAGGLALCSTVCG